MFAHQTQLYLPFQLKGVSVLNVFTGNVLPEEWGGGGQKLGPAPYPHSRVEGAGRLTTPFSYAYAVFPE